jgi:ribose/xylose/arabinose/galactoside ABC-type transport system permease subunit
MLLVTIFITIGLVAAIAGIVLVVKNKDVFFTHHNKA